MERSPAPPPPAPSGPPPSSDDPSRSDVLWGWVSLGVLALAIVLRIAALVSFEGTAFARWPQVDAWTYWEQAQSLFKGKDPFTEGYYQPPGYPWILSALFDLTGKPSLSAVRVLHAVLGFFSTWAVLWMGNRLGRRLDRPWLGPVAGLLFTLYPTMILFELDILTPAVTTALFLGALVWLWTPERPGPWRSGVAGVLLGLDAMVHPTYLLVVPALALALWLWRAPDEQGARQPAAWVPITMLLIGTLAGTSPTAVENLVRWDQLALVSHNSGINLYLGNNPDWKRTAFLRPGLPFRKLVLEAEPDKRNQFERNDYWVDRTLSEARQDPAAFVSAVATKAWWSFNHREIPRNEEYLCRTLDGPTTWIGWLPVRYGWLLPFGVLGAVVLWKRRNEARIPVLAWPALHVVPILFIVSDRYRVATWPLLALAGAVGVGDVVTWVRSAVRGTVVRPPLGVGAALVAVAVVLPWLPLDPVARFHMAWCNHLQGNLAVSDQRWEEAERYYVATLEEDPEDMGARQYLAESYMALKRYDDAAKAMEPLLEAFPDSYPALMTMTEIYEKMKEPGIAAEYCGRAYRVPGPRTNTGVRYVRLLVEAGHLQTAREVVAADPALAANDKVRAVMGGR